MNTKDREISRAWNSWNMAFRRGFSAFARGEMNTGNRNGSNTDRGFFYGWMWAKDDKPLPDDPSLAAARDSARDGRASARR